MDTCDECGFTYGTLARRELVASMGPRGRQLSTLLGEGTPGLSERRTPTEWSPLEYGCHIRDILSVQRDRLFVALVEEEPSFKPMYRDQRVDFDRYAAQEPEVVGAQLLMAAAMTAHAFDGLSDAQWERTLIYNFPEPARRDVEWVAHHTLHEMVHHENDIRRRLAT